MAAAAAVPVRLAVDGNVVDTVTSLSLAPDERARVVIRGPECKRLARVEADPEKAIAETSETDNAHELACAKVVRSKSRLRRSASTADTMSAVSAPTSNNGVAPEGTARPPRTHPIGGQAVLEGVMMRGISTWAVAVRKPSAEQLAEGGTDSKEGAKGEIEVISEPLVSWTKRHRLLRLPVVRGVVALGESLKIGFRALGISANAQMPPDEEGEQQDIGGGAWAGTIVFALLFAVGLFFLLPGRARPTCSRTRSRTASSSC